MSAISELTSIPKSCAKAYAGIKYFLVGSLADIVATPDVATRLVTIALTTLGTPPALLTDVFKKYYPAKETSSLVNTYTGTPATGAGSSVPVATILVNGQKIEIAKHLAELKQGCLVVVAVGFDDVHEIAGISRGMDVTAIEDTTGVGANDMKGNTVTITGSEPDDGLFIDATTLLSILPLEV
jgi:hypothetical protein